MYFPLSASLVASSIAFSSEEKSTGFVTREPTASLTFLAALSTSSWVASLLSRTLIASSRTFWSSETESSVYSPELILSSASLITEVNSERSTSGTTGISTNPSIEDCNCVTAASTTDCVALPSLTTVSAFSTALTKAVTDSSVYLPDAIASLAVLITDWSFVTSPRSTTEEIAALSFEVAWSTSVWVADVLLRTIFASSTWDFNLDCESVVSFPELILSSACLIVLDKSDLLTSGALTVKPLIAFWIELTALSTSDWVEFVLFNTDWPWETAVLRASIVSEVYLPSSWMYPAAVAIIDVKASLLTEGVDCSTKALNLLFNKKRASSTWSAVAEAFDTTLTAES